MYGVLCLGSICLLLPCFHLLSLLQIRLKTKELINGYIQTSTVKDMSTYIVLSRFHAEDGLRTSGIVGSLHVAFDAYVADSH